MPGSNLTRSDAARRAEMLSVGNYEVGVDLTSAIGEEKTTPRTFHSHTRVTFECTEPGASTWIDLIAHSVKSATLNGAEIPAEDIDVNRGVTLRNLAAHNELVIDAECLYMNTGEGMHRSVDPADNEVYLYTQFESREASRVYACFDQPDLKATFTLTVLAPEEWRVFSNATAEVAEENGAKAWRFAETRPLPTYITAIVAGPYVGEEDEHDGIPLGIYCRRSMREYMSGAEAQDILTVTKQGLDFFQEKFGYRYPFGKYDQLFVPEFNAGAMENAGCVTHNDEYMLYRSKATRLQYESRATTILHEMAHMWFGDLVTMRWWDDLWLNESFAEWASQWSSVNATQYTEAWATFAGLRKAWGLRQDQLSSTHPVAADAPDVETAEMNFDGITYAKGAAILKQLVAYVGEETFLTALRSYFREHEYGNATLRDLLAALESASGRNMSAWARSWLETSQVNTVRPVIEIDADGRYTSVQIEQTAPADHPTLRPHAIAVGAYNTDESGNLVRTQRVEVEIPDGASHTDVSELVGTQQPELLLVNDDDLAYVKIRMDQRSLNTVVENIATLRDPLARTLCWGAAWDMVRDAVMRTREYVQMGIRGLGQETTMGVVQGQLAYITAALENYADRAWEPTGRAELCEAAWQNAGTAEPGSDAQLVWVRAAVNHARSEEALTRVRGLLEGDEAVLSHVPELRVDADLRWSLLLRLVTQGVASDQEIAEEIKRDNTDKGARMGLTAHALRPSAEAKAEAWQYVMENPHAPNQSILAVMRGFGPSQHADLLRQYVPQYFEALPRIWEERTSEVAVNIAEGMFPSWEVSQELVDRTQRYLDENPELPTPLRRALAEGRDGVVRALRARTCDAA